MNTPHSQHEDHTDRLFDLLADRALEGLANDEARELDTLVAEHPEIDEEEFDRIAARIAVDAVAGELEPMPEDLRAKIESDAHSFLGEDDVVATGTTLMAERAPASSGDPRRASMRAPGRGPRGAGLAWLAAAAGLLLAVLAWWPEAALSPAELRDRLVAKAPDVQRGAWGPDLEWKDEGIAVRGDFVWSNDRQEGYLVFEGMPVNDPTKEQYQLWIVDPNYDHPIDGGVFDCDDEGRLVIPIDAKLLVRDPNAFAVTIEKPGGVVVSEQKRRVLVAVPSDDA